MGGTVPACAVDPQPRRPPANLCAGGNTLQHALPSSDATTHARAVSHAHITLAHCATRPCNTHRAMLAALLPGSARRPGPSPPQTRGLSAPCAFRPPPKRACCGRGSDQICLLRPAPRTTPPVAGRRSSVLVFSTWKCASGSARSNPCQSLRHRSRRPCVHHTDPHCSVRDKCISCSCTGLYTLKTHSMCAGGRPDQFAHLKRRKRGGRQGNVRAMVGALGLFELDGLVGPMTTRQG